MIADWDGTTTFKICGITSVEFAILILTYELPYSKCIVICRCSCGLPQVDGVGPWPVCSFLSNVPPGSMLAFLVEDCA